MGPDVNGADDKWDKRSTVNNVAHRWRVILMWYSRSVQTNTTYIKLAGDCGETYAKYITRKIKINQENQEQVHVGSEL